MKANVIRVMCVVMALTLTAISETMEEIKERRKARQEQVQALVTAGDATENDNGYLDAKEGLDEKKQAVIKAENEDRKKGYEIIAKSNGKTVEEIGKLAAKKIKKQASDKK